MCDCLSEKGSGNLSHYRTQAFSQYYCYMERWAMYSYTVSRKTIELPRYRVDKHLQVQKKITDGHCSVHNPLFTLSSVAVNRFSSHNYDCNSREKTERYVCLLACLQSLSYQLMGVSACDNDFIIGTNCAQQIAEMLHIEVPEGVLKQGKPNFTTHGRPRVCDHNYDQFIYWRQLEHYGCPRSQLCQLRGGSRN